MLNESPIYFIDTLVNISKLTEDDILTLIGITLFVNEMDKKPGFAVDKISKSNTTCTFNAIKNRLASLSIEQRQKAIDAYIENKTLFDNDLILIKRKLFQIYKDAGIQVHNDV